LLAARQAEGVKGELAADGASELRGDVVLRQGAVPVMSVPLEPLGEQFW
jgi:hypothetical protein